MSTTGPKSSAWHRAARRRSAAAGRVGCSVTRPWTPTLIGHRPWSLPHSPRSRPSPGSGADTAACPRRARRCVVECFSGPDQPTNLAARPTGSIYCSMAVDTVAWATVLAIRATYRRLLGADRRTGRSVEVERKGDGE